MNTPTSVEGTAGGIEIWIPVDHPQSVWGTACFCCHEPLTPYGAVTDRQRRPNRICFACYSQWKEMPSRMLFEIPRHVKLPKGQLVTV
jgi:hypothetical protein